VRARCAKCGAGRVFHRRDRLIIVRDRRKVVRAALEKHTSAECLAHKAIFARCVVPAQQPHRVQSVGGNAAYTRSRDRALHRDTHFVSDLSKLRADVCLVMPVEHGESRGQRRRFARQSGGDPRAPRRVHERRLADHRREWIPIG